MEYIEQSINAIRVLSAEQITRANSGHPGICMGMAPVMYELYSHTMNYDSKYSKWQNRDRFVLSSGHGSAMLYSTLHLFGFDVTAEDLKGFRQFATRAPGHPERGVTDGVDVSTGALGQGIAQAVGMALAESHLAAIFNREGYPVVDHYTYCICGEGCLEEGIGYEACSFAGTNKLGKLILFYDCNKISIEGNTDDAFGDDVALRFKSQHWQVIKVDSANDLGALRRAIAAAKRNLAQPTVIICPSVIGYGTPLQGTSAAHGSALTPEQLEETKRNLGWTAPPFEVPQEVREECLKAAKSRARAHKKWQKLMAGYRRAYPQLAKQYDEYFALYVPDLDDLYDELAADKAEATRISGGKVINALAKRIPNLLSGSADLSPSTKTNLVDEGWYSPQNRAGRNIHFGIREHAMAAICNGIAAHGGLRVICSTFLVFSDYMKGAMRLSAIMKLPVMYVLTHDSIGVGEDGPTHQPIEQLAMLRAMPDTDVYRPADRCESINCFISALGRNNPAVFAMTRQNLVQCGRREERGGYVISGADKPTVILVASGSEVGACLSAQSILWEKGIESSVVSMYCTQIFDSQDEQYKRTVLPEGVKKVCVEASSDSIWYKYAEGGKVIQMTTFGQCGPMNRLFDYFGLTGEKIAEEVQKL